MAWHKIEKRVTQVLSQSLLFHQHAENQPPFLRARAGCAPFAFPPDAQNAQRFTRERVANLHHSHMRDRLALVCGVRCPTGMSKDHTLEDLLNIMLQER